MHFPFFFLFQLEVYHGVLNDIATRKDRSCFYLRQPPVAEEMNEEDYKVYCGMNLSNNNKMKLN